MVHPGLAVKSNDVAFAHTSAANGIVGTIIIDSAASVAQGCDAVGTGPNEVPLDRNIEGAVPIDAVLINGDAVTVSGNHVVLNQDVLRVNHCNSGSVVEVQGCIPSGIRSDEIALNRAGRATVGGITAERNSGESDDDITFARAGATDCAAAIADVDPDPWVSEDGGAGFI